MSEPRLTPVERAFVWLGGAAFVSSLAVGAYAFVFDWGTPAPAAGSRGTAIALNTAAFTIFGLHHSVFARTRVKHAIAQVFPERLLRSVYVWLASTLFVMVIVSWRPLGGIVYQASGSAAYLLIGVQAAGVFLSALSVRAIDALELAGIRIGARNDGLQVDGPYRLVRHPLYFGWVLMVFGAPLMTGDRFLFAAVSSLYLVLAIPWEERSLRAAFGEAYTSYTRRVRWRLIPLVY